MLDPKGRGLAVPELGKRERYERSNREATSTGCVLRGPEQNRVGQRCVGRVGKG